LNELLNATEHPKTPSLTVFFKPSALAGVSETASSEEKLLTIRQLVFTRLIWVDIEHLVTNVTVEYDPQRDWWEKWYCRFIDSAHTACKYRVRLHLNVMKLWRHRISLSHIIAKIKGAIEFEGRLHFVRSHDALGVLDMWVSDQISDFTDVLVNKEYPSTVVRQKLAGSLSSSLTPSNQVSPKMRQYITKAALLSNVLKINLSGVEGLTDAYYTEATSGRASAGLGSSTSLEWRVDTKGGKLKSLFRVEEVDGVRCTSNDMHEVNQLFGIEGAKNTLKDEFSKLIDVNTRHMDLLIDTMTSSGGIQRVTRNGIDRKQVGTIAKASFEQPVDNFLISAANGENDPLKGVSASITVGKLAQIGTGFMELLVDTEKLLKLAPASSTSGVQLSEDELQFVYDKSNEVKLVYDQRGVVNQPSVVDKSNVVVDKSNERKLEVRDWASMCDDDDDDITLPEVSDVHEEDNKMQDDSVHEIEEYEEDDIDLE
jgi:DNA-directed RNA polymerase II subunit RPB1